MERLFRRIFAGIVMAAAGVFFLSGASAETRVLVPGGQSIGVALEADGLIVVGASDIGASPSPARLAGLKQGDVIRKINGQRVGSVEELARMLGEDEVEIGFLRGVDEKTAVLTPVFDPSEGVFRLGAWVRDGAAGIGTLTYYDPSTGSYGALGHAVADADTGVVLPVEGGAIYRNEVVGIEKGRAGRPGELLGQFFDGGHAGIIEKNTECGIFGSLTSPVGESLYPEGLEIGALDDVREGRATLITTLTDGEAREYECRITGVDRHSTSASRSFTIIITDEALLDATGGIVQGMSGSPILQNGRLIGAVTHVMVNEPSRGYGVSIENMLSQGISAMAA